MWRPGSWARLTACVSPGWAGLGGQSDPGAAVFMQQSQVLAVLGEGLSSPLNARASLPAEQLLDLFFLRELFSTFTGGQRDVSRVPAQWPNAGFAVSCVNKPGQQDTR